MRRAVEHTRVVLAARTPYERVVLLERIGRYALISELPLHNPPIAGADLVAVVASTADLIPMAIVVGRVPLHQRPAALTGHTRPQRFEEAGDIGFVNPARLEVLHDLRGGGALLEQARSVRKHARRRGFLSHAL